MRVVEPGLAVAQRLVAAHAAHQATGRAQHGVAGGDVVSYQLPNWWEACVVNLAAALFGYRLKLASPDSQRTSRSRSLPRSELRESDGRSTRFVFRNRFTAESHDA